MIYVFIADVISAKAHFHTFWKIATECKEINNNKIKREEDENDKEKKKDLQGIFSLQPSLNMSHLPSLLCQ